MDVCAAVACAITALAMLLIQWLHVTMGVKNRGPKDRRIDRKMVRAGTAAVATEELGRFCMATTGFSTSSSPT